MRNDRPPSIALRLSQGSLSDAGPLTRRLPWGRCAGRSRSRSCSSEGSRCWSLFSSSPVDRAHPRRRSSGSAADQRGPRGRHPGRVRVPQPERPDEGRVRAGREPIRRPRVRSSYSFSNDVLYQIRSTTRKRGEDLVIQARFEGYESFRDPRCARLPVASSSPCWAPRDRERRAP